MSTRYRDGVWRRCTVFVGLLCVVLAVGCASSKQGERDDVEAEASAPASASASSERTERPDEDTENGSGPSTGATEPACRVVERDWRGLDFHDATDLHRALSGKASALKSCLSVFPSDEKIYVVFEIDPPRIASARPAELSKNAVRRLDDAQREKLETCLADEAAALDLEVEPAGERYEVTHPFCAP